MAKAIGYLRVSSAKQARDGKDGFPRQREAVRAYCTSKRIELVEEHADAGVSGTMPLEGREGLSTALARCTELGAEVLVVEKADRLGRDLIVSEMAVRAFAEAGVSIVTADTGQSLTDADNDPSRKLIRQVLNAVAEYERSALVAKLRAARERKRRSGGHSVGCYRFGEHPERPHEIETLALARMLRRRVPDRKRRPLALVAEMLNQENRLSRTGRPWTKTMVRDLLNA
ncbi:MAG: recombinase family protein [Planctomycetes bacterium]|nr:recombinase family protein [Planctomycetota bacterium]